MWVFLTYAELRRWMESVQDLFFSATLQEKLPGKRRLLEDTLGEPWRCVSLRRPVCLCPQVMRTDFGISASLAHHTTSLPSFFAVSLERKAPDLAHEVLKINKCNVL